MITIKRQHGFNVSPSTVINGLLSLVFGAAAWLAVNGRGSWAIVTAALGFLLVGIVAAGADDDDDDDNEGEA